MQNASDVILIARPDTTITYQTPSAQRILGYDPGALEGMRLTSLLHPNDVEQALAAYGGRGVPGRYVDNGRMAHPASATGRGATSKWSPTTCSATPPSKGSSSRCVT